MNIVVPLAGPDYIDDNGIAKGDQIMNGEKQLIYCLHNRPWHNDDNSYIFILQDKQASREFSKNTIESNFKNHRTVFVNTQTGGAALTALAGVSVIDNYDDILIIDLADIFYTWNKANDKLCTMHEDEILVPSFNSNNPIYSYLKCEEGTNQIIYAEEKRVISENASAGTYIFGSSKMYIGLMYDAVSKAEQYMYNGLYYVCPIVNAALMRGCRARLEFVNNVYDMKIKNINQENI